MIESMQYGLDALRVNLENHTNVVCSASGGCAVKIASLILDQTCEFRTCAVRAASEAIQHGFGATGSYFEDRAKSKRASVLCRTVEISGRIQNQASCGRTTISAAAESVQHTLHARRIQLEYGSGKSNTAHRGRTVKVALGIHDEARLGDPAVVPTGEGVKSRLFAFRIYLKDDSRLASATGNGCPIEVAGRILNQTGTRVITIRALVREGM